MSLKIFLVEDHDIVRKGVKALLENEQGLEVVGEASNGEMAIMGLQECNADLVIMDMNMPGMNGLECTRRLRKIFPDLKVLILSMHDHEHYLIDMLDAGAAGYVLKHTTPDELVFAIRKIANDGIYIGPEFTLSMLAKYKAAAGFIGSFQKDKEDIQLSEREMDVLQLIAKGLTNIEIADKLYTSRRTIETRRKNILDKTGTTNTATLMRFAVLNGLIK